MSVLRYLKYKDSGIDWLGEIPEHWGVAPIKSFSTCNDEVLGESTPTDYEIEYVEISSVDTEYGIVNTNVVQFGDAPSRARRRVKDGDIIVSTVRTYLRAITPITNPPDNMIVSTGFAVIRPRTVDSRFLGYMFRAEFLIAQVIARSVGVSYPAINASELIRINVPIPTLSEQTAIADFLDRETKKIEALVAEQERLILLLKEKRQAVIFHAVTKGLDTNVPMKDSGIEWLGEIPSHWSTVLLKRVATIRYGIGEPPKYQEEGIPLIRATNVNTGRITDKGLVFLNPEDIPEKRIVWLEEGDIIVVRSGAYTGDSAIIRAENLPCIAGFDMVVRSVNCQPDFLQYALVSTYIKNCQIDLEKLRAAQPHLNAEELGSCIFVLPPKDEQTAIAEFLDHETKYIDELITEAERAIELLEERRTALISAAVTGKIDVRGFVPEEVTI